MKIKIASLLFLVLLTGGLYAWKEHIGKKAQMAQENAIVLQNKDIPQSNTPTNTSTDLSSMTTIPGAWFFLTKDNETTIYFERSTLTGFITDAQGKKVSSTSTSTEAISGSDKMSLVLDGTSMQTDPYAYPVVLIHKAHDKNHSYVVTEERYGCYGDTMGCIGNVTLTIK